MSPIEAAAAIYDREFCARSFPEDLQAHYQNGYVFATPEAFLMGRAVNKDAPYEAVTNPWHVFPEDEENAWLIYLAAGATNDPDEAAVSGQPLTDFFRFCPYPLPWLCWERDNRLRAYPFARVWERVMAKGLSCM